jgi:Interferon-induced transmembrane protein/GYF domain 2
MIHLSRNGTNYGPYEEPFFRDLIARRQVVPGDFYWREGMEHWLPVEGYLRAAGLSAPAPAGETPDTFLAASILVTLLCCPLTGVPAIVYAARVHAKLGAGDMAGARVASRKALFWCVVSVLLCLVIWGLTLLL